MSKFLTLLFLIIFAHYSWGQGDLSSNLKGQAQTSKVNVGNIQLPNNQVTKTGSVSALIETGNKNILVNPSFEHSTATTGWTCSGAVVETTIRHHGLKSLKISPTGAAFECYQDSTINAAYMGGTNLTATARIYSTFSGAKLCSRNDGTTSTTNCSNVSGNSSFAIPYAAPFIGSTTSNGISITSAGVSVTGDIYIDDTDLSPTIIATQDQSRIAGESYFAGTTNCAGWARTSTTIGAFSTDADCPGPTIVRSSMGTWTTTDSDLPRQTVTNLPAGTYEATFIVTSNLGASTRAALAINDGTTTCSASGAASQTIPSATTVVCTFSYTSAGDRVFELYGGSNSNAVTILNDITSPSITTKFILKYFGSGQVYSASCGANCAESFTATVAANGTVSEESPVGWINGNCTNADPRVCTFDSGLITVAMTCYGDNENILAYTSAASVSVDNNAQITKLTCFKTGADRILARTIFGSFNEAVTTPNVSKPALVSASISASETITENESSFVSSCTNADPAVCTLTASFFTADPKCWSNPIVAATIAIVTGDTTSTVTIDRTDASTAFTLFCAGAR